MTRFRGMLTAIAFVVLTVVSLATMAQAIYQGLPKSVASSESVLIKALATEDLSRETRGAKLKYGQRLQRELDEGTAWPAEMAALSESQRQRLIENVGVLAKESLDLKVDEYFKKDERRRPKLLDRHVEEIAHWATLVERVNRPDEQPLVRTEALVSLFAKAAQWYRDESPERIKQLQEYQGALREAITRRFKRRINPTGP